MKTIGITGLPGSGVERIVDEIAPSVIPPDRKYRAVRCRYDLRGFTYVRLMNSTKGEGRKSRLQHSIHDLLREYVPSYSLEYDKMVDLVNHLVDVEKPSIEIYENFVQGFLDDDEIYFMDFELRAKDTLRELENNHSTEKPTYLIVPDIDHPLKYDHLVENMYGLTVRVVSSAFERKSRLLDMYDDYTEFHIEDEEVAWMDDINWNLILDVDELADQSGAGGIEEATKLLTHALVDKWAE